MTELQVKQFVKWYTALDKKTDQFHDIYVEIDKAYWDIKDPDDFQMSAFILHGFACKGDEGQIVVAAKIINEIFIMHKEKRGALSAILGYGGKDYQFTLTTDKTQMSQLQKLIMNTAIVKSKEEPIQ